MALESVVQSQDPFGYTMKELCSSWGGMWGYGFGGLEEEGERRGGVVGDQERGLLDAVHANWDSSSNSLVHNSKEWEANSSSPDTGRLPGGSVVVAAGATEGHRRRRRTKKRKNKEEMENQRMTHIVVERNRRRQMNQYLATLRSLMPASYAQRGDQASIIGGAINFVKELEQLLQSLEAKKRAIQGPGEPLTAPFADFFAFPQYSTTSSRNATAENCSDSVPKNKSTVADIEVSMVESHANLKVLTRERPRQLVKMIAGLESLMLATLHLNMATADQMILYTFSLKIQENCRLSSVSEIAAAVHQMMLQIEAEAGGNKVFTCM